MIVPKLLAVLVAAVIATTTAVAAEEKKTTTEKMQETASDAAEKTKEATKRAVDVVAAKTREAWNKTKAYFSDDPAAYRTGATQRLHELSTEIAQLRDASGVSERLYWSTLVQALQQQHQYAMDRLLSVPQDAKRREAKRDQLDKTISYLEGHIDIAQREMRDFAPKS